MSRLRNKIYDQNPSKLQLSRNAVLVRIAYSEWTDEVIEYIDTLTSEELMYLVEKWYVGKAGHDVVSEIKQLLGKE